MLGAAPHVPLGPADKSFIDLDTSPQRVASWSHHGPTKLVEPCPSGGITPQPQNILDAHGTGPVLLADDVPNGSKPQDQRFMGVLKDRPRRHRGLVSTPAANQTPARGSPHVRRPAARARKPFRPTQRIQIVTARFLRRETPLQLHDCSRVILHGQILDVGVGGVNWIPTTYVYILFVATLKKEWEVGRVGDRECG